MVNEEKLNYKIYDPLEDGISMVSVVQHAGDDKMIVNAARTSFGNDNNLPLDSKDEKLIRYLIKHKHGSPFEHNMITFKIVCPIFVDRHFVKHRAGVSKNEISGRYVELQDRVYIPTNFRMQSSNNRQASIETTLEEVQDRGFNTIEEWDDAAIDLFTDAWNTSYSAYKKLLDIGVTREQARGVLPLSLYTESYYTFNMRSLLHLISLRDHEGAQYETQLFAKAMKQAVEPLFPITMREWFALHDA